MSKEQSIADRWAEEDRQQSQHIADLEAENARLRTEQQCDECEDSPEEIRLPAQYRCYYCNKGFCGPHAKTHFTKDGSTAVALADAERERDRYKALAERCGEALTETTKAAVMFNEELRQIAILEGEHVNPHTTMVRMQILDNRNRYLNDRTHAALAELTNR